MLIKGKIMKGFITDITQAARDCTYFRKVLYTTKNSQLVVMHLQPSEDIGEEVHDVDQILCVVEGSGEAVIDGNATTFSAGFVIVVPKGARHNIKNTSSESPLKLYTVYAPPHHKDGIVHATKAESEKSNEHFDGTTSEPM